MADLAYPLGEEMAAADWLAGLRRRLGKGAVNRAHSFFGDRSDAIEERSRDTNRLFLHLGPHSVPEPVFGHQIDLGAKEILQEDPKLHELGVRGGCLKSDQEIDVTLRATLDPEPPSRTAAGTSRRVGVARPRAPSGSPGSPLVP